MSNPLLSSTKFGPGAAPPSAWPGQPGAPVPPAPDNRAGSPWPPPPPPRPGAGATLRRGGVASATAVLLAIIAVVAVVGWNMVETTTRTVVNEDLQEVQETSVSIPPWLILAVLVGFALVIATYVKPAWARVTAPLYAVAEGLFIGAVSKVFETRYEGIVVQAVGLTIGVFTLMLVLYATGRIRVTPRFRLAVIAAMGGIFLVYLTTAILGLFTDDVAFVHSNGIGGIGFSLVVVTIAALNLTLDFDFVDRAEQAGAPRQLEWLAALGLVVSLVWLYIELLNLLSKLRSR